MEEQQQQIKKKRGRPAIYSFPFNCEFCNYPINKREEYYYHRDFYKYCFGSKAFDMSALDKRLKAEAIFPIVFFNPLSGITAGQSKTLSEIQLYMETETRLALLRRRDPQEYIKEGISICFENVSNAELNKLKNFFSERRIDYAEKQQQARDRIDAIIERCGMIVGQATFNGLLGNPPNHTLSMEKMLINHIRQRNAEELEISEGLIEAIYVSIKQTKVFRDAEASMKQFAFIEECLDEYLKGLETPSFIHSHGQLASQVSDATDY